MRSDTYPFIDPTKLDLSGKHVFLSGASKGVGRATAIAFVKAGISAIAIAARSNLSSLEQELKEIAAAGGRKETPLIKTIALDIADHLSIERAAAETKEAFGGKLDILINNAGTMEEFRPALESDPEVWWKTWTVNVRGTYLLTRALLPLLLPPSSQFQPQQTTQPTPTQPPTPTNNNENIKQIITLTSIGAFLPAPGGSAYQLSKLALLRYAEYLNLEYGSKGIMAYAVHPGAIPTELGMTMPRFLHGKLIDKAELAGDTVVWLVGVGVGAGSGVEGVKGQWGKEGEGARWLAGRYVSCTWDMEEFLGKREEVLGGDLLKVRLTL